MPVVPFAQPQAASDSGEFRLPGPKPDDTWSLMAAAQMHMEGRLVQQAQYGGLPDKVQSTPGKTLEEQRRDLQETQDDIDMIQEWLDKKERRKTKPIPVEPPAKGNGVS